MRIEVSDWIRRQSEFMKKRAYWLTVPHAYRLQRHRSSEYVDLPVDPFEITYTDPDRIVQFTGREYPPWRSAWDLFGATLDGDWDVREVTPVDRSYRGTDADLYLADTFSESVVYRSLEAHFSRDVPWDETQLVRQITERIKDDEYEGHQWNRCTSVADVREKCTALDNLYEDIKRRGCKSIRELNAERGYPDRFREVMINEILVDVGRDGELLFVDGRHRLSIGRILGLDEVPVAKLVRHENSV